MVREGGGLFGSWEALVIAEPFWAELVMLGETWGNDMMRENDTNMKPRTEVCAVPLQSLCCVRMGC